MDKSHDLSSLSLSALMEIGKALASPLDHGRVMQIILDTTKRVMKASMCSLRLINNETGVLELVASSGLDESLGIPIRVGEGIVGRAVQQKKTLPVDEISRSEFKGQDLAHKWGLKSLLCVPLVVKGKAIGGLTIYSKRHQHFKVEEVRLFNAIASQAAVAIENAQLFHDCLETFRALAQAVEARDEYTRGHSERVTYYVLQLADYLKLDEEETRLLRLMGPLHDLGKVGVPETVLQKKEPLTDKERGVIERHVLIGENILKPIKFFEGGLPIVRSHHEWVNGSGYPDGLTRDQIPLLARLVGIVDAFDAMTSNRPYRRSLKQEEAIKEIRRFSGRQFDSELVAHFVELVAQDPSRFAGSTPDTWDRPPVLGG